jgi:hypothetical protein
MTVYAGSAAGLADGGKARMKSLSGSTLTVAPNFIEWTSYPYITIKKVIEPWAILPDLENDYEDGNKSYTNENLYYHPLGRIGTVGRVAFTNVAEKFWSDSAAVATSASLSTHAWTFPSGSPASSSSAGSASSPIEVTWSAPTGHTPHYVKYVVTDSNGKTHTRWQPVWVFDTLGASLCDWVLDSCSGSFDSGSWQASFTVYTDADIAEFPEDAMVVIFAEDHYAGHLTSIGGNWEHAENIVFGGWIARDTVTRNKNEGYVSFDVLGPVDKMKELLCWPANLEDKTSPDTWHELSRMTCDRAGFHIMTEHTTMHSICDLELTGSTKRMLYVDIPEANPHTQIQDYCLKPIGANLLSDRQGRIYFDLNPNLRLVSDRSSIPVVISLDINTPMRSETGLVLAVEEHSETVAQVDFIGFGYTGEDPKPYYALAPGDQHPTGDVRKVDGIRADSQSEANTLSGLYLAEANNIWREVKIPVFNWRIFDIAPQEYTELTLVASDTRRGVEWSAQKLICRYVELEYNHEKNWLVVSPSFEKDSFGPAGITGDYPDSPPRNDGSGITPWPGIPKLPPTMQVYPQSLLISDGTNGIWWLPLGGSAWVNRSVLSLLATKQVGWDPWWFTEQKKASSNPEQAIIFSCHDGKIYRSENLGEDWVLTLPDTDPPNDWSDSPAPTVADLTFTQRTDNIHKNGSHYFLAEWQESGGAWRGWLLATDDDALSWSWISLRDLSSAVITDGTYYYGAYDSLVNEDVGIVTIASTGNIGLDDDAYATLTREDSSYCVTSLIIDMGASVTGTDMEIDVRGSQNLAGGSCPYAFWKSSASVHISTDKLSWTQISNNWTPTTEIPTLSWGPTSTKSGLASFRYIKLRCEYCWYNPGACDYRKGYIDAVRVANVSSAGGDPATQLRPVWADVDTEDGSTLYLTLWADDKLHLWVLDTADLDAVPASQVELGSCTITELNNGTYYAAPFTPTFNKERVYIFGRMASPGGLSGTQHLIQSVDSGATFTSIESGLGTSLVTNFMTVGDADGSRMFYGIVSNGSAVPKLYKAIEGLTYVSDTPLASGSIVNVDAFSIKVDPDTGVATIAVGSPSANAIMVVQSEDGGSTWGDATLNLPITGEITTCVFV